MIGIELLNDDIIESFLWENRKLLKLIKIAKKYEIYEIKEKHLLLYVTTEKNEKRCFNTQILKNLSKGHKKLNIDTIELLSKKLRVYVKRRSFLK